MFTLVLIAPRAALSDTALSLGVQSRDAALPCYQAYMRYTSQQNNGYCRQTASVANYAARQTNTHYA
jgi:hypothetical protein